MGSVPDPKTIMNRTVLCLFNSILFQLIYVYGNYMFLHVVRRCSLVEHKNISQINDSKYIIESLRQSCKLSSVEPRPSMTPLRHV